MGNRGPKRNGPKSPTSGQGGRGGQGEDYFRRPKKAAVSYATEPDGMINPDRVTLSRRMMGNPIRNLTFEKLVSFLDQWKLGFFRGAGMAWEAMEGRDYQLKIVAPKRKKSVARNGYDVLIVDTVPAGDKALAEDQRDYLKNFWDNISVTTAMEPDEEGSMGLLLRQMMDAVGKRYAVHEIVYQPGADGSLTAKFIFCPIWWFEGTKGKLRFLDSEFQVYGREMAPGEWLVTVGDGLMEACSVVYLLKHLPLKSWINCADKVGMPGLHAKTDALKGSQEWNSVLEAVQQFSEEWSAVTSRNVDFSLIEAKIAAGGDSIFSALVEKMDRAITQLWRGGDLGTSSSKNATGASLQDDETEILDEDDAKMLGETLTLKVSRYALAWKFGPDAQQYAYIQLRTRPKNDVKNDILVDEFLLESGAKLGMKATMDRYDRPMAGPDEELLTMPVAAPTVPAGGPEKLPNPGKASMANSRETISDKLLANALPQLARAVSEDFHQLTERILGIAELNDPALIEAALRKLQWELNDPKSDLVLNVIKNPASAKTLSEALTAGLFNGMAAGALTTN